MNNINTPSDSPYPGGRITAGRVGKMKCAHPNKESKVGVSTPTRQKTEQILSALFFIYPRHSELVSESQGRTTSLTP